MSLKSVWLDKKYLLELKDNLENIIGATMLYLKIRDYIYNRNCYNSNNFDGEFLINIFDDKDFIQLEKLDKDYYLLDNQKNLINVGVEYGF